MGNNGKASESVTVSDADLDSALRGVLEDQKQEDPNPEPEPETPPVVDATPDDKLPDEPTDHAERSRLGRRLKSNEDSINEIKTLLQSLVAQKAPAPAPKSGIEPPEVITTMDDLEAAMAYREQKKANDRAVYEQGYGGRFMEVGANDPFYKDVEAEMLQNFNTIVTGNPSVDAELNYRKAKEAVLLKKLGTAKEPEPKMPGRGEKPTGTGATLPNKNSLGVKGNFPLDAASEEFIRRVGMSDDSVRAALGL